MIHHHADDLARLPEEIESRALFPTSWEEQEADARDLLLSVEAVLIAVCESEKVLNRPVERKPVFGDSLFGATDMWEKIWTVFCKEIRKKA